MSYRKTEPSVIFRASAASQLPNPIVSDRAEILKFFMAALWMKKIQISPKNRIQYRMLCMICLLTPLEGCIWILPFLSGAVQWVPLFPPCWQRPEGAAGITITSFIDSPKHKLVNKQHRKLIHRLVLNVPGLCVTHRPGSRKRWTAVSYCTSLICTSRMIFTL